MINPKTTEAKVVFENGESFVVTQTGSRIKVDNRICKIISIALKIQNKFDQDILFAGEKYENLVDLAEGINCHKMALFLRGEITTEHLIDKKRLDSGHAEVYELSNKNPDNIFWTSDDLLKKISNSTPPVSVHLLRIIDGAPFFFPSHSFIWLGKDKITGEDICFQKVGPGVERPFEITNLASILDPYLTQHADVMHEDDLKKNQKTEYMFAAFPF